MKQRLSLWMMSLLFGILPMTAANVTSDPSVLEFGKMWVEGGCIAKLTQRLCVEVKNTSDKDYYGVWLALDEEQEASVKISGTPLFGMREFTEIQVPTNSTATIEIYVCAPRAGKYKIICANVEPKQVLFNYELDVVEYQEPQVSGSLKLNMLEQTSEGNVLYCDTYLPSISGTIQITNDGENSLITYHNPYFRGPVYLKSDLQLANTNQDPEAIYFGHYIINPDKTITVDFNLELAEKPEEGKEYYIEVGILEKAVASMVFTIKQCTNTYWTADGTAKPLPLVSDSLKVPAEALAVDLRGLSAIKSSFSIDVSEANPNCLYYLGFFDILPQGFISEKNIIRGEEAKTIVLDANYDYYCPMPFKAREAMFTYTPVSEVMGPANTYMSQIMSAAFILPFDAQKGWLNFINDTRGTRAGFFNEDLGVYDYNEEASKLTHKMTFCPVADFSLKAYTPYLMYVKPSPVTFYAEDIIVPANRAAAITTDNCMLTASTKRETKAEDAYLWSCDRYYFYNSDKVTQVRPFNVMLTLPLESLIGIQELGDINVVYISRSDILPVPGGEIDPTDIKTLRSKKAQINEGSRLPVFSLSGQRVATMEAIDGCPSLEGLKPGMYIIGGKKVVVR